MTHEELITSVELAIDEALRTNRYNSQRSRVAARAAIRITGEACCDMRLTDYPAVQTSKIKELTQGNKT